MQIITLSGKVHGACEMRKDKNGNNYIRFKVYCTNKDTTTARYTLYRCYCYDTSFSNLKDDDTVFLTGDLNLVIRNDENGKTWINTDVYVRNMTKGD